MAELSPAMVHIKSEVTPLVHELEDLEGIAEPTPDDIARIETLHTEITAKKSAFEAAAERHTKRLQAGSVLELFNEPMPQPRAVYERPSVGNGAALEDQKGWFDTLVETKGFKRGITDQMSVRETMSVNKLYPFFETKAPFIVANPTPLLSPSVDVYSPYTPRARHALLDLVRRVQTNQFNINYLPLTFVNNAHEVAWGGAKPESTNAGTIQTITQTTIAHWKETVRQQLHYMPQLRGEIETELQEGVLTILEYRIIRGTGTGTPPEMLGLLAQPTMTGTGADLESQIFFSIGAVENAGGTVDAIVMNPQDYSTLLKAERDNNAYNPLIQNDRFGTYRIVKTSAMPSGKALVGDWGMSVTLYVGDNLRVDATEALGFKSNVITFRAEMDSVVLLTRPWLMYECPGPLTAV